MSFPMPASFTAEPPPIPAGTTADGHMALVAVQRAERLAVPMPAQAPVLVAGLEAAEAEMMSARIKDRVGLGWRPEIAAGIFANLDHIDVVEIIADDYFA